MDILSRTPPPADHRIHYGADPLQFGDLRLPVAKPGQLLPVAVILHGGWWQSAYDLEYMGHVCAALKNEGVATWSLEYRRVGNAGGAWPGTMQDAAAGFDYLAVLAKSYPLDLRRVIAAGHSAGGHLAFWLAGRQHIPSSSALHQPQPVVPLVSVVGLAGAVDLRLVVDLGGRFPVYQRKTCGDEPDRRAAERSGGALSRGEPGGLAAAEHSAGAVTRQRR